MATDAGFLILAPSKPDITDISSLSGSRAVLFLFDTLEKSCCSCFFFLFVLQTVETRRKLSSPSSDNFPSSWAAVSKGDDVL